MITLTISLNSISFYLVLIDVLAILFYGLYFFHKKRTLEKNVNAITQFVLDYFMSSGTEVKVKCFQVPGNKRFITLIESEPMKRFRYSNVLESSLIGHIHRVTGTTVEKIYWRFPIQNSINLAETDENIGSDASSSDDGYYTDPYLKEKQSQEYKVSEATWDEFIEVKK